MNTKIIVTVGPATNTESHLAKIKEAGVNFVRVNMSHSSLEDLKYFINLSKKVDIPFIIDTEGSQIRTGNLYKDLINFNENDFIEIYKKEIIGDEKKINLKPGHIIDQLEKGDLIYIDFNTLILKISDISTKEKGFITAKVIACGSLGKNKAVIIDPVFPKKFSLPPLSKKDYQSIELGLNEKIGHIAVSFVRKGSDIDEVRRATKNSMKIISKIECFEALENLDEIISKSDYLLIDRGDLSKEISIEKIPLTQKIIISKAKEKNKGVFVATNLLETMIREKKPTRAEANDVVNTILDGAEGLILAAETAIGNNPFECLTVMNKLIKEAELVSNLNLFEKSNQELSFHLKNLNYLLSGNSSLIPPHGGKLVNRIIENFTRQNYLDSLFKIELNENLEMDVEQIAIGAFSPLEGFMNKDDLDSVLDNMRLKNGLVWTIPIILDVTEEQSKNIYLGQEIALTNNHKEIIAILNVEDIFKLDKENFIRKLYGTEDISHPGVKWAKNIKPIIIGGKINLIKARDSETKEYELTPKQTRRLFEEKDWTKIIGFHTRNVIHKSHEFIQLKALEKEGCHGLFIHPIIGKKKPGDFHAKFIIEGYKIMNDLFYPKNKVVFSTFSTFSRYAGPREAIFTALCRKNFGCSHFIVGRDHTGVRNFYHPKASHEIFSQFKDLGIKPIFFDQVFFSKKLNQYVHEPEDIYNHTEEEKLHISGTEARRILEKGEILPDWFMRPEISQIITDAIKNKEEVFIEEKPSKTGSVIWFTGLSGSGKTTLAEKLKEVLKTQDKSVFIIDGDSVRNTQNKHLGFSQEDIRKNNFLIAELAKEKRQIYDFVLIPVIAPYLEDREKIKNIISDKFIEFFINSSLEACIKRDVKGLYQKALKGEINNFIGLAESNPYESPKNPDLEIKTDVLDIKESLEKIIVFLKSKNLL
ncbi:MAG: sulfate adenylyltransferase [Candidatus Pacebacteria bacterium]|nr:sulfate adenylyltransferase [Candidatus Paceibacterota bacterium]